MEAALSNFQHRTEDHRVALVYHKTKLKLRQATWAELALYYQQVRADLHERRPAAAVITTRSLRRFLPAVLACVSLGVKVIMVDSTGGVWAYLRRLRALPQSVLWLTTPGLARTKLRPQRYVLPCWKASTQPTDEEAPQPRKTMPPCKVPASTVVYETHTSGTTGTPTTVQRTAGAVGSMLAEWDAKFRHLGLTPDPHHRGGGGANQTADDCTQLMLVNQPSVAIGFCLLGVPLFLGTARTTEHTLRNPGPPNHKSRITSICVSTNYILRFPQLPSSVKIVVLGGGPVYSYLARHVARASSGTAACYAVYESTELNPLYLVRVEGDALGEPVPPQGLLISDPSEAGVARGSYANPHVMLCDPALGLFRCTGPYRLLRDSWSSGDRLSRTADGKVYYGGRRCFHGVGANRTNVSVQEICYNALYPALTYVLFVCLDATQFLILECRKADAPHVVSGCQAVLHSLGLAAQQTVVVESVPKERRHHTKPCRRYLQTLSNNRRINSVAAPVPAAS